MNLPESVRISWRTYRIEQWHPVAAATVSRYGEIDHVDCVIKVDTSYGYAQTVETLIHEVFHGIWTMANMHDAAKPSEEFIVGITANGFTQVLLDNPAFRRFITSGWRNAE